MAKTLVQTREELQTIENVVTQISRRFESEFGEKLLIKVDEDGKVTVGITLQSDT